jgi:hypothetical protein
VAPPTICSGPETISASASHRGATRHAGDPLAERDLHEQVDAGLLDLHEQPEPGEQTAYRGEDRGPPPGRPGQRDDPGQYGQQRPQPAGGQRDRPAVHRHLRRPQHPDRQHPAGLRHRSPFGSIGDMSEI